MFGPASWRLGALFVASFGLVAGACAPPPADGGGVAPPGSCPNRSRVVLASNPVESRQTGRAFSPDGQWLVTSSTDPVALELQLMVRRTDGTGVPVPATKLVVVDGEPRVTRIVASTGGDVSVIGQPVHSGGPGLWTWFRDTGQLVQRMEPILSPPAGRTLQSMKARNLSEDGSRAVWVERTVPAGDPAGDALDRTVLAHTATGAVIGVVDGDVSAGVSPDATLSIRDGGVVDLQTGQWESLDDARQALLADGMQSANMDRGHVSDGGRYVAWHGWNSYYTPQGSVAQWRVYRWDRVEQALVRNPSMGTSRAAHLVSSDGRVLYRRSTGIADTDVSIREWDPDTGTDVSIDSGTLQIGSRDVLFPWGLNDAPATSDLRHVAVSWLDLLPVQTGVLRLSRCH